MQEEMTEEPKPLIEHKGKLYARVTSHVLGPFIDFKGIDEDVLKRKAAIGTRVHDAIQEEINGGLAVLVPQEAGYLKSFEKWRRALTPTFIETEVRRYCDKKMMTGCTDALVKLEGEEKAVLVDWKTSVAESPIVWPMQAHLYYHLLVSSGVDVAPRFLFVKLDRYGDLPKVFQYKLDSSLLARCLQAADDFWLQNQKNVAINQ